MCSHQSSTPSFDGNLVHVVAAHPEQGWSLLCDGAIMFDDTGELTPDGQAVGPHRVPVERLAIAA
ncbi:MULTISPECIES: DUF5999 family protein [unclassified Streptomyces]|uniref:DUF5999 family protein n=1 Tax=unclassified Streptomyces TaxID=2593676 RepID=UPI003251B847